MSLPRGPQVFYQKNWEVHRSITRYFRHMDGGCFHRQGAQSSGQSNRRGQGANAAGTIGSACRVLPRAFPSTCGGRLNPARAACPTSSWPTGILTSRIVRGLLPPLVCVLISSYLVCVYEQLWQDGTLDAFLPAVTWPNLAVSPEGPFSISTFALSLLLVFRTNSSYER